MQHFIYLRALAVKPNRLALILALKNHTAFVKRVYSSVSPSRKQIQTSKISFVAAQSPQITKLPEQSVINTTKKSKLKEITKKYGAVGIIVYIGVGCLDLGVTLGLIQLAGLDKVKSLEQSVLHTVRNMGVKFGLAEEKEDDIPTEEAKINEIVTENGSPSFASIFVLAYGIHKTVMLPVRIGVTAYITPAIVRKLHQMGWSRYFPRLLAASVPKKP